MYKIRAPGSLMLFGEHAVLYGGRAVVAAIDQSLVVNLIPRNDNYIRISSAEFGEYWTEIDKIKPEGSYQYVLSSILLFAGKISKGFDLLVSSDFSSKLGFGSSAAISVATIGAIYRWCYAKPINHSLLYHKALGVVRKVQGVGSGADVAASVFGGVLSYGIEPTHIRRVADDLPLVVVYSGSKLSTPIVINQVRKNYGNCPKLFDKVFDAIDCCSRLATEAIKLKKWRKLGILMNVHQGLHDALGVNTDILSSIIFSLRSQEGIFGAKISGSGLGDCVVALGEFSDQFFKKNQLGIQQLNVAVGKEGFSYC